MPDRSLDWLARIGQATEKGDGLHWPQRSEGYFALEEALPFFPHGPFLRRRLRLDSGNHVGAVSGSGALFLRSGLSCARWTETLHRNTPIRRPSPRRLPISGPAVRRSGTLVSRRAMTTRPKLFVPARGQPAMPIRSDRRVSPGLEARRRTGAEPRRPGDHSAEYSDPSGHAASRHGSFGPFARRSSAATRAGTANGSIRVTVRPIAISATDAWVSAGIGHPEADAGNHQGIWTIRGTRDRP